MAQAVLRVVGPHLLQPAGPAFNPSALHSAAAIGSSPTNNAAAAASNEQGTVSNTTTMATGGSSGAAHHQRPASSTTEAIATTPHVGPTDADGPVAGPISSPYVIVSHSMGCWVAFELLMLLKAARLAMPSAWFLSAMPAPDTPVERRPWRVGAQLTEELFKVSRATPSFICDS